VSLGGHRVSSPRVGLPTHSLLLRLAVVHQLHQEQLPAWLGVDRRSPPGDPETHHDSYLAQESTLSTSLQRSSKKTTATSPHHASCPLRRPLCCWTQAPLHQYPRYHSLQARPHSPQEGQCLLHNAHAEIIVIVVARLDGQRVKREVCGRTHQTLL
jgi:hypothetical protein